MQGKNSIPEVAGLGGLPWERSGRKARAYSLESVRRRLEGQHRHRRRRVRPRTRYPGAGRLRAGGREARRRTRASVQLRRAHPERFQGHPLASRRGVSVPAPSPILLHQWQSTICTFIGPGLPPPTRAESPLVVESYAPLIPAIALQPFQRLPTAPSRAVRSPRRVGRACTTQSARSRRSGIPSSVVEVSQVQSVCAISATLRPPLSFTNGP